ncbi:MAG: dipeptide ABC transporter ATP-binding protein [Burkholderiaceae bacterium]|jgi:microcin C transport system ATP-binding protein|nr:dipeptide ABC transporter ATP-binding protein [Burkholderiaceae bacterium]
MTAPLLHVENLNVAFFGKPVAQALDFSIAPGEKLALVGESGSGKTVTVLALLRLLDGARITGRALFDDSQRGPRDLLALPERELRRLRGGQIAMVFQEPMTALNPLMTVGAQIAEVLRLHRSLTGAALKDGVLELLARTGIPEPARRAAAYPHQLSGGQRQRAMIAMALAGQPRLLLADEPTTALDVSLRGQILQLLSDLQRETGMAVLLITHDLNLVRRFADRVAVMQHGHLVEQGAVADIFARPAQPYTRELIASRPERQVDETAPAPDTPPIVQAEDLCVSYPVPRPGWRGWFGKDHFAAVRGARFALPPGRTLGVIGESGSGKSTLGQAVLGLLPHQGAVAIAGRAWQGHPGTDRPLRRIAQVVFQDPFSSLSPRMTLAEIVGEGLRVHQPSLTARERTVRVRAALAETGLTPERFPDLLSRHPHEFSGGQRQRIALARALIVGPQLLVLDEPTSALDVTIQKQIIALLQRLQREHGLAYLLITHDVDVVRALAHQVLVLKDGAVVEQGCAAQVLTAPQHPYTRQLLAAA